MNEIKSLADQLRSKIAQTATPVAEPVKEVIAPKKTGKVRAASKSPPAVPEILTAIRDFSISEHKNVLHVRFDPKTAQMLTHFKMATGTEITKLIAFSVDHLFEQNPELKSIIKQFIQELEL
jgi:putative heme iron utilization protein